MKHLLTLLLFFIIGTAAAFDYAAVQGSKGALTGSIDGTLDDRAVRTAHYLPGYGLHIGARHGTEDYTSEQAEAKLVEVLTSLAPTVRGLAAGDYISISYQGRSGFLADEYVLVVRMKADDPESLEVWLDGELQ